MEIGVQESRAKEEQLRAGVYYQMVVACLVKWELWSPGLVSQVSWTRVSCCQRGQTSSDGCCCEAERVVGLCDIDRRSRTHISI